MAIPHVAAGAVAQAAAQNDLIDAVNTNTSGLDTAQGELASVTTRVSTLESRPSSGSNAGAYFGQWTDNNAGVSATGQTISSLGGQKVTEINVAQGSATGCRLTQGTLTVDQPGVWLVSASVQYQGSASVRAMWLSKGSAGSNPSGKSGSVAGPSMDVQSADGVFRLAAGESVSVYSAVWKGDPVIIFRALSNNLTAVWLGP